MLPASLSEAENLQPATRMGARASRFKPLQISAGRRSGEIRARPSQTPGVFRQVRFMTFLVVVFVVAQVPGRRREPPPTQSMALTQGDSERRQNHPVAVRCILRDLWQVFVVILCSYVERRFDTSDANGGRKS